MSSSQIKTQNELGAEDRSSNDRIGERVTGTLEQRYARTEHAAVSPGWTWSSIIESPITIALVFILLINGALLLWQPLDKVDPNKLPATHTWAWWATQEFMHTSPTPPVVLIGSSLVMHSVSRQDADFLNHDIDYVRHHRSDYLESLLKHKYGNDKYAACFNFALPGDLISDDYMIVRTILAGDHAPKYIVLGLSLRDFIDNAVNCVGTTPPFRYLKRFAKIDDIIDLAMPRFWQQLDYTFGKIFYLWQKKLDLQVFFEERAKKLLIAPMATLGAPSLLNNLDYRHHVPANLHSEVEEGMAIVKAHEPVTFDPNFADYRRRCGNANWSMFNTQAIFLTKLLELCKERGIKVVLINMPLTPENVAMMPAGSWEKYIQCLTNAASAQGVPFIDFNRDKRFTHEDFYDTAHMNSSGGKKFLEALTSTGYLKL
jgi:hypothetical protein